MLFVDGMLGVVAHSETVQWLYTLCASLVSGPPPSHVPFSHCFSLDLNFLFAKWAGMKCPSKPRRHLNTWLGLELALSA